MGVHYPEHLANGCLTVGHNRFNEQFANQCVQRSLVAVGICTPRLKCFVVDCQGDVSHAHIIGAHWICVHRN